MRAYWVEGPGFCNFGDQLTPFVLSQCAGVPVEWADGAEQKKTLAVGSHLGWSLRAGDVVWGSGLLIDRELVAPVGVQWLAVRGPLTWQRITRIEPTSLPVYGDPALLLPLLYEPRVDRTRYAVGIVPHYEDKREWQNVGSINTLVIDVQRPWPEVVGDICRCRRIVSSSLHGIVAAEAYGIPAQWAVWSKRLKGGTFKFRDYYLGTGRGRPEPFAEMPPIEDLCARQRVLIEALQCHPEAAPLPEYGTVRRLASC